MSSPAPRPTKHRFWTIAVLLSVSQIACNPTFNWRELRPEGTPLQALMPCKPEVAERTVPLGASTTVLHMHSCKTGGLTFAVAWVQAPHAADVPVTMTNWQRAALSSLRVDPALLSDPARRQSAAVPGAMLTQGLSVEGTDPQGQPVQARAVYFARGDQVFQAAIYGAASDEVESTFFEGLKLP